MLHLNLTLNGEMTAKNQDFAQRLPNSSLAAKTLAILGVTVVKYLHENCIACD